MTAEQEIIEVLETGESKQLTIMKFTPEGPAQETATLTPEGAKEAIRNRLGPLSEAGLYEEFGETDE